MSVEKQILIDGTFVDAAGTKDCFIEIPSGRTLAFRVYGDANGLPVLQLHGSPGSAFEGSLGHAEALKNGLKIIAPDRPGYGLSSRDENGTLKSQADDLVFLMNQQGASEFGVIAVSGGAPFAYALAHYYPEKVLQMSLVSALGPLQNNTRVLDLCPPGFKKMVHLGVMRPWITRLVFPVFFNPLMLGLASRKPSVFLKILSSQLGTADRKILENELVGRFMVSDFLRGLKTGVAGLATEFSLFLSDWNFSISDVSVPVSCWHGSEDHDVPLAFAEDVKRQIPHSILHIVPGEGHFSLVFKHTVPIMEELAFKMKALNSAFSKG